MTDSNEIIHDVEQLDDGLRVSINGDVNLTRSPELRTAIMQMLQDKPKRLTVDLTQVNYMDSSGVATLIQILREQHKHGGSMELCGLRPKVRSIFEIARLDTVFTILDDEAQQSDAV